MSNQTTRTSESSPVARPGVSAPLAVAGFTMLGLLASIAIIGILSAMAVPAFTCQLQKSKMASALADLSYGAQLVEAFEIEHGEFPYTLSDAYGPDEPPDRLIYCLDDDDGNSGHGNQFCSIFDGGNASGQNEHGGVVDMGYSLRLVDNVAPCANFSTAWTYCCGREPRHVPPGDETDIPGHPGNSPGGGSG